MIDLTFECVGSGPKGRPCRGTVGLLVPNDRRKNLDIPGYAAHVERCPKCGRLMRLRAASMPGERFDVYEAGLDVTVDEVIAFEPARLVAAMRERSNA